MDPHRKIYALVALENPVDGCSTVAMNAAPLSTLSQAAFMHGVPVTAAFPNAMIVPRPAGVVVYPQSALVNVPQMQMPRNDSYPIHTIPYMTPTTLQQDAFGNLYWNAQHDEKQAWPLTSAMAWSGGTPEPVPVAGGYGFPTSLPLRQWHLPQTSFQPHESTGLYVRCLPLHSGTVVSLSENGYKSEVAPDHAGSEPERPGTGTGTASWVLETAPLGSTTLATSADADVMGNGGGENIESLEASVEHLPPTGSPPQQERPGNSHDSTVTRTDSPDIRSAGTTHNQQNVSLCADDQDRHSNKECQGQPQGKPAKTTASSGKRPRDPNKPKRPLSAYNIFFKEERANLIKERESNAVASEDQSSISMPSSELVRENTSKATIKQRKKSPHRKITFKAMATIIAKRWKNIESERLKEYMERAAKDKQRYQTASQGYLQQKLDDKRTKLEMTVSEETRRKYFSKVTSCRSRGT